MQDCSKGRSEKTSRAGALYKLNPIEELEVRGITSETTMRSREHLMGSSEVEALGDLGCHHAEKVRGQEEEMPRATCQLLLDWKNSKSSIPPLRRKSY